MASKPKPMKSATTVGYEKIKYLNKWLLDSQNKLAIEFLTTDEKLFNSNLKYRLFNVLQNHPKIIKYLNKYLNDLYFFSQQEDPTEWLSTFKKIIQDNKIDQLHFFKYQNFNIDKFHTTLKSFTDDINIAPFNSNEISNFYKLYQNGLIKLPGEQDDPSVDEKSNIFAEETIIKKIPKSESILNLVNNFVVYKTKRQPCISCPAFYSKQLVLDTNLTEVRSANILIISDLHPSLEDIAEQQFLSTPNGKTFKKYLQRFADKTGSTYVVTTLSLCVAKTDIKKQVRQCKDFAFEVTKAFDPQYIIVLGNKVKTELGIKGTASQLYGKAIGKYFLMSSLSDLDKKDGQLKLDQQFMELEKLLGANHRIDQSVHEVHDNKPTIKYEREDTPVVPNSKITKNDTLFNIERIGENLLYIFIDPDGNKKFNLVAGTYPVYYKRGTFADCNYIESEMDAVIQLSLSQKRELSTLLNQKLQTVIKC